MFFIKITLLVTLSLILVQDYKERKVYWFFYPLVGILVFLLQYNQNGLLVTLCNSIFNLGFIGILLVISYLYNLFKLRLNFLEEVLGLGDVLFLVFISFSFSTISFVVLLVFSLLFSLLVHVFLGTNKSDKSIPLAGYMSLFFAVLYLLSFIGTISFIYAI